MTTQTSRISPSFGFLLSLSAVITVCAIAVGAQDNETVQHVKFLREQAEMMEYSADLGMKDRDAALKLAAKCEEAANLCLKYAVACTVAADRLEKDLKNVPNPSIKDVSKRRTAEGTHQLRPGTRTTSI